MRLLVVDDEKVIVKGLVFNLSKEGYDVDTAFDGEQAVELVRKNQYTLVLMDRMMPKLDGLEACIQIREFSNVPIIMLTAKDADTDKIIGLEYGADDYITKPFNIMEVKARIRALIRRAGMAETGSSTEHKETLSAGHITLDIAQRTVSVNGIRCELTVKEFDLLELLMNNRGRVYNREMLLDLIWGYDYEGDARTVDVHIRRLREKIELDPANPTLILTKWGIGYYFNSDLQ